MSYEGYIVDYCRNGHLIGSRDCYDEESGPKICSVCKETRFVFDSVDETNGCECEHMPEGAQCGCHERVIDIIGWTQTRCVCCDTKLLESVPVTYKDGPCENKQIDCWECHGTGIKRITKERKKRQCSECKGTGVVYVPRFDLKPVLGRYDEQALTQLGFTKDFKDVNP